jgi:hypothetical protein
VVGEDLEEAAGDGDGLTGDNGGPHWGRRRASPGTTEGPIGDDGDRRGSVAACAWRRGGVRVAAWRRARGGVAVCVWRRGGVRVVAELGFAARGRGIERE